MIRVTVALLLLTLVGAMLVGLVGAGIGRLRLARARRRLDDVLGATRRRRVDEAELIEVRSRGRGGGAGHGGLALTPSHLVFVPDLAAAPVVSIPLDALVRVDVPRRHRRVVGWDRMLRVTFDEGGLGRGGVDEAVWRVDDAEGWARDLTG